PPPMQIPSIPPRIPTGRFPTSEPTTDAGRRPPSEGVAIADMRLPTGEPISNSPLGNLRMETGEPVPSPFSNLRLDTGEPVAPPELRHPVTGAPIPMPDLRAETGVPVPPPTPGPIPSLRDGPASMRSGPQAAFDPAVHGLRQQQVSTEAVQVQPKSRRGLVIGVTVLVVGALAAGGV